MGLRIKKYDVRFGSYLYAWNTTFLEIEQGGMESTTFMDG